MILPFLFSITISSFLNTHVEIISQGNEDRQTTYMQIHDDLPALINITKYFVYIIQDNDTIMAPHVSALFEY